MIPSLFLDGAQGAVSHARVVPGDTVYSILKRNGFNDNQRQAALGQNVLPKSFVLAPGDIYKIYKDASANRTELRFFSKKFAVAHSFWRVGGSDAGAKKVKINYKTKPVTYNGKIRGSIVQSIEKVVGDDIIGYRFMDAFLLNHRLAKEVQRNANFSLTVDRLYDQGQFVRFGEIRRAELEIDGRNVIRIFRDLGESGFFYGFSDDYLDRPLYAPVEYIRISSLYQPRRLHPIKKYRKAHLGIDFELPEGAPVVAAETGKVIRTGKNRAAGNFIVLRHNSGYESYYNHLSQLEGYKPGSTVYAGAKIGEIGCTGYCTKPHLHFAVKKRGAFVNPADYIRAYSYNQRKEMSQMIAQAKR